jgi:integrase
MTIPVQNLGVAIDQLACMIAALPHLPSVIQYEDDYDEKLRSIRVNQCVDSVTLHWSGEKRTLKFAKFADRIRPLIRAHLLSLIQRVAPQTVVSSFSGLLMVSPTDIESTALGEPIAIKARWSEFAATYSSDALSALKGLFAYFCLVKFGSWSPNFDDFVSRALPVQGHDMYASVRSGDAFLTMEEEARLVRWLDTAANQAQLMDKTDIELACLVVCSYQFGMRPKQLGMLRKRDCSVRVSPEDGSAIVHLAFRMIKQRDTALAGIALNRKVKREWAPLFVRLMSLKTSDTHDLFLLGFSSRWSLSAALIEVLCNILENGSRRVAYDLRHSMAQRLVDSGASHEELAAAMGHSQLASGLVYFRASANQAELVNKALGISSVYQRVAKIAADKYISPEDLRFLKEDQQIAGVPHGIPIAGIGGCKTGQPSCPYNPVTACYGCPKFMPVIDIAMHEKVLGEFRGIVHLYKDVSRGEAQSPAYLQLQRTINEVMGVIQDLKGAYAE